MRLLRWIVTGVAVGVALGFLGGLVRARRPPTGIAAYVPPEPSRDHRAIGPHVPGPPPVLA